MTAYLDRGIVTPRYRADALHIAVATVNDVDIVVSWNFKHIVHFDKIAAYNAVSQEFGYKPLRIHSPYEVIRYE